MLHYYRGGDLTNEINVYVVLNNRVILGSHTEDDSTDHDESTVSNSGFIRCLTGQQIWMRADAAASILGSATRRWNTFSVYLMVDEGLDSY